MTREFNFTGKSIEDIYKEVEAMPLEDRICIAAGVIRGDGEFLPPTEDEMADIDQSLLESDDRTEGVIINFQEEIEYQTGDWYSKETKFRNFYGYHKK